MISVLLRKVKARPLYALIALAAIIFAFWGIHQALEARNNAQLKKSIGRLITYGPFEKSARADRIVILLQGSGMGPEEMMWLAHEMAPKLPQTVFIAPEGIMVDTPAGTRKWYDLLAKDQDKVSVQGVSKAGDVVLTLIHSIHENYGFDYDQISVFGFSQGGSVALYVAMHTPQKLGAVLSHSGVLFAEPARRNWSDFSLTTVSETDRLDRLDIPYIQTPLLLVYGESDIVVDKNHGIFAKKALQNNAADVSWHLIPDLGHGISPDTLHKAVTFLQDH